MDPSKGEKKPYIIDQVFPPPFLLASVFCLRTHVWTYLNHKPMFSIKPLCLIGYKQLLTWINHISQVCSNVSSGPLLVTFKGLHRNLLYAYTSYNYESASFQYADIRICNNQQYMCSMCLSHVCYPTYWGWN